ncbi:hypothetical protein DO97_01850 [Neosynechococcus sphagnicola sy1]|uniref:Uncharacterized protein n=1 Tax=Neosynechococcus sphagnicola sy1 TaxID=1497020 RepID=A0A098TQK8_9CYAN|nr:hypothetical protein DO97_01850 [Neosynechococcus sphagnicola sy1]
MRLLIKRRFILLLLKLVPLFKILKFVNDQTNRRGKKVMGQGAVVPLYQRQNSNQHQVAATAGNRVSRQTVHSTS